MFSKAISFFKRFNFIRRRKKDAPTAKNLLEQAEEQKKELLSNTEVKKSFEKVASLQKKVLEENPDFAEQLQKLKNSLGEDGKYDKAVLCNVLEKTRNIYENDPKFRVFFKQQEEKLLKDEAMRQKMASLATMQQQVLQVA